MKDLTINDYLNFFNKLNLKRKVELLRDLTVALNNHIHSRNDDSDTDTSKAEEEFLALYGAWKNDDEMTEENIIHRTVTLIY